MQDPLASVRPEIRSRGALDRDERQVKDGILRMGSLVESQIRLAIRALVERDPLLAREVVTGDALVNGAQRVVNDAVVMTIATLRIEELIAELRRTYTIVIVTHNMQQASRISDRTAFFTMGADRAGYLVEVGDTARIFTNPSESLTEDYVSGRFG